DLNAAVAQAVSIATRKEATVLDGSRIRIEAETLCVHGDRPNAALFAERLRRALQHAGVRIAAVGRPA
ncbi:MAG TPA: LamB/YcsF family protein, partial [Rhodanobacteraceae bacterium]|nr:LamB/YcsF family protein [Rhodanobacteraceae bacterium]